MAVYSFLLSAFSPVRSIALRELNGYDESLAYDNSTQAALQLLNNIIVQQFSDSDQQKVKAEKIAVSDRDYLLSGVYKYSYGSRVESSLNCSVCGERYDLNFSLDDLIGHSGNRSNEIETDNEGFFKGNEGARFRLPNGEDEIAVLGLRSDQAATLMFNRCLAQPVSGESKKIMEIMEELGPVLTTDLSVNCPECDSSQNVQFDMQSFLLTKLRNERERLAAEVHSIAVTYAWSHHEILDLSRSMRQTYVNLINQN